jgi:hypothetical protein
MSIRAVRWVVLAVCVLGIAGMIVASVNDNNGAALTFGLLTTAAVLCLVVATAVTRPPGGTRTAPDEEQAAVVEDLVHRLVATGIAETQVRALVREAVRLGRGEGRAGS